MNMRLGWALPLLSALVTVSSAGRVWSQVGPMGGAGPGASPAYGMMDPAMMAAMQAQAYAGGPQAGGYGPYAMPAMYAPQGMQPGVQPVAYMPMPGGAPGMMPPSAGAMPMGATPDVYGSYGYMPQQFGAAAPGGGPVGYGGQGYPPEMYAGGGPGGPGGQPMYPGGGPCGPPGQPMYDQGGGYGGGPMGGNCQFCGGNGCGHCGGGHGGHGSWLPNGLLGDCLGLIAPYPDGGCAAPRWFDFAVDYMMMKRDNTGRSQDFTSDGILGPVILTTDDLDFGGYKPGFRFSGAFQLAAANSLEFTYFGQFNYTSSAAVRSPTGNLFSVFSDFGATPIFGTAEYDNADFQQITYQSEMDSFEINWRRRWMAPNCRYQGSWTLGVRHFILDEVFRYDSTSSANGLLDPDLGFIPARGFDSTYVTNNLTGIQIGTDAWVCLLPGLRIGGELQAGVYGNHMNINTHIISNQQVNEFREELEANDVSFLGQANLLATYRLNYQWTLRAGYQFLYVEGVALASENFNNRPPLLFVPNNPRVPIANDNGSVFYHGWNVGLEYQW
jgi:hypothetical protein